MRVFDCFIIRDEIELLKIRINELKDCVDVFVIVEANKTFSGEEKPFYVEDMILSYDNIRYIQVTDMPEVINGNRWPLEYYQRNCIMRGLYDLNDRDIVMISDVDEIWDLISFDANAVPFVFENMPITGYLNILQLNSTWYGTLVVLGRILLDKTPQQLRDKKNGMHKIKGGWHFSWVGGRNIMEIKARTFCHTAQECLDAGYPAQIMRNIDNMSGVAKIDKDILPKYVQENWEYFKEKGYVL